MKIKIFVGRWPKKASAMCSSRFFATVFRFNQGTGNHANDMMHRLANECGVDRLTPALDYKNERTFFITK